MSAPLVLDGPAKAALVDALLRVFIERSAFDRLCARALNQIFAHIVKEAHLGAMVFELVVWTEAQGRTPDLLRIALETADPHLRDFARRYYPDLESSVLPVASRPRTSPPPDGRNTIFVAYDHRDEALKNEVLPHLAPLRRWGGMEVWDDRAIKASEDWYARVRDTLARTRVALCLVSKRFLDSDFCMEEELPYLFQHHWAGQLEVLPILVGDCAWKRHPWLARLKMRSADDASLARLVEEIGDAWDAGWPVLPPAPLTGLPSPAHVDLSRLPPSGDLLLGREKEWNLLDDALGDAATPMVVLRAPGGVGKSTLVKVWTDALYSRGLGLPRAFAWSFYSQGTGERVTSGDLFIATALAFFGDADPKQGDPWEKGERLARLVAEQPTLLVLDGLEPLQEGGAERGRIKDPSILTLLEALARENPGLCVVTTREAVVDLRGAAGVRHEDLEHLSKVACRALLRIAGVKGEDKALEKAAEGLGHHALAILLLSTWLQGFPDVDIAHVSELPELEEVRIEDGRHPRRVLEAWASRLEARGEHAALELLHVLGLFDRPAELEAVKAVIRPPVIQGLNRHLGSSLENALQVLRAARLVAPESHHQRDIDAHPLVREHFGARLWHANPRNWRSAQRELLRHYAAVAPYQPNTLEEMEPLFRAVVHGCAGGMYDHVFDEILWRRIHRDDEFYLTSILGAFGTNLALLASFFAQPWRKPEPSLSDAFKADVLGIPRFRRQVHPINSWPTCSSNIAGGR